MPEIDKIGAYFAAMAAASGTLSAAYPPTRAQLQGAVERFQTAANELSAALGDLPSLPDNIESARTALLEGAASISTRLDHAVAVGDELQTEYENFLGSAGDRDAAKASVVAMLGKTVPFQEKVDLFATAVDSTVEQLLAAQEAAGNLAGAPESVTAALGAVGMSAAELPLIRDAAVTLAASATRLAGMARPVFT